MSDESCDKLHGQVAWRGVEEAGAAGAATHLMAAVVPRQTVTNCDDFVGGAGLKRALVIMTLKDYSGFKT